jgi:hypothetical protein
MIKAFSFHYICAQFKLLKILALRFETGFCMHIEN